jgi:hypothetical protein
MIKQLIAITAITACCLGNTLPVKAEGLTPDQKREIRKQVQWEMLLQESNEPTPPCRDATCLDAASNYWNL